MRGIVTRAGSAGTQTAKALIEMVHLMYQRKTAVAFLTKLVELLQGELDRRRLEL